jgi:hypothetical protein
MLKFKVTEAMIDAGIVALKECSIDHALRKGEPVPDFDAMDADDLKVGRGFVSAVIQAAAGVALGEPKDV